MKHIVPKIVITLFIVSLCGAVNAGGRDRNCHFAFGNGVAEQIQVPPGTPSNPYLGPIRLRIGGILLDGMVDMIITDGFNVPDFNPATGVTRITGFGKATFDFGADLGAFHTWEVDTSTFVGPPPPETTVLHGDIRTGPRRDAGFDPNKPWWGEGYFKYADVTFKGLGWNRFNVVNQQGEVVNEFTYFVWGKICDVDLRGIRRAMHN